MHSDFYTGSLQDEISLTLQVIVGSANHYISTTF